MRVSHLCHRMDLLRTVSELRYALASYPSSAIGFVPTMGNLHEGHLSLIQQARQENAIVIVSIFVNPTQFDDPNDYQTYPRTLEADLKLLEPLSVNFVFSPTVKEMYPVQTDPIRFQVGDLARYWCGAYRPGHFDGVVQIVTKLFNLVQPRRAYFGEKDYQQLRIIEELVKCYHFPIEIVRCPTVREADGLAMSSRNRLLTPEQRKQAVVLYRVLSKMNELAKEGMQTRYLIQQVEPILQHYPLFQLQYLGVADGITLHPLQRLSKERKPKAMIAGFFGSVRLIDNIPLNL